MNKTLIMLGLFFLLAWLSVGSATAQTWIQLTPAGGPPAPRGFHGTTGVYDAATNRMTIFAGMSTSFGSAYNDVWVLTGANGLGATPEWINLIPHGASGSPPRRAGHTAVYDATTNRMIIFGGCGGGCEPTLNDVWVLTDANGLGGTPTWIQLSPAGGPPAGRTRPTAVYDPAANRMIVWTGHQGCGGNCCVYSDLWVLTNANGLGGTPTWIQLSPTGAIPPGRYAPSATYDSANNRMTVFGGSCSGGNAVWVLDHANGLGGTPTWTTLIAAGMPGSPPTLNFHSAVYDAGTNQMTVFGGSNQHVWVLDHANGLGGTATWTELTPTGGPPAQEGSHAAGYDAAGNRMIIFGGHAETVGTLLNDTWVLTEVGSSTGPLLTIPTAIPAAESEAVAVDVDFASGAQSIAATAFSVDYDQSCLDFDESDADPVDGIPDAIDVRVPADFGVTVFHNLGDGDGEIDVSIFDFTPPISTLPDGTLISVTFTATCSPDLGATITAPVVFSTDPEASFSDEFAQDVDGVTVDGSVVIYPGPRGDCNGNGEITVADLVADGLEIFDGDGSFWVDAPGGTFLGSPVGCDANADTDVDAGDVSCTILLIFGGTCGGGGSRMAQRPPAMLRIDGTPRFQPRRPLRIPVRFESYGHQVSSLAFSLNLDSRRLRFDPADRDRDGVPDAVRLPKPAPFLTAVRFDRRDRDGEIDVLLSLEPGATFEDGVLLVIEFEPVRRGRVGKALRFSSAPEASFGNGHGESVPGRTVVGGKDNAIAGH